MARIGISCLPMSSHINLFLALAEELSSRGHRITFFDIPENEIKIRSAGFDFESIEPNDRPTGTLGQMMRDMGNLGSLPAMCLQGCFDKIRYKAILERGPMLLKAANLDGMIVDQADACSGSVADSLGLPWVSVANGLCMNAEPSVPPFFTSWTYRMDSRSLARNRVAYLGIKLATRSLGKLINGYRKRWGLSALHAMDDAFSSSAQICQQNREFDFPRTNLPPNFHYVGPIRSTPCTVEFPWHRLDGRPVIYASLGTVVNRHRGLYRIIAESCRRLDAQLVISLGGVALNEGDREFSGAPLVVQFAPQRELLARAALTITHGGLNTTMESLSHGVPMVVIPIAFEQPGIAARIRWTGTGDFVPLVKVTVPRLRECITKVMSDPSYRRSALLMAEKLRATRGREEAADIVERVICKRASHQADPQDDFAIHRRNVDSRERMPA